MKFDTKVGMFVKNRKCPTVKLRLIIGGSVRLTRNKGYQERG